VVTTRERSFKRDVVHEPPPYRGRPPASRPGASYGRRPPDWRHEVEWASGLNVLAGVWLIISPWVVGYGHGDAVWNPVVFGAIVGVLTLAGAMGAYREVFLSWINAAIGVWLFISAFWLASTGQAFWNDLIMGVVVFVLAIWSAGATPRRPTTAA
jgi:hypothetical protein